MRRDLPGPEALSPPPPPCLPACLPACASLCPARHRQKGCSCLPSLPLAPTQLGLKLPLARAAQYSLPFTASPALGILMLNDFVAYLNQTDVSQITWAQYMEPSQQNGTGLVDLYGNARPAWHAFNFWGDLPVERVVRIYTMSRPSLPWQMWAHKNRTW